MPLHALPRLRKRFVAALSATVLLTALLSRPGLRAIRALTNHRARRVQDSPALLVSNILRGLPAARRAWPGYEPFDQPLLIVFPKKNSLLLGTSKAPRGFTLGHGGTEPAWSSARGFKPSFSYLKAFDLDGSTVTALSVGDWLDADQEASYFFHEHFHGHQDRRFREPEASPYLVEDERDVALAWLETRSLADWIEFGEPDSMRDFASVRAYRRRLFPGSAAELREERIEGTARFVELAARDVYASTAAVRRNLLGALRNPPSFFNVHKWRDYAIGAALCLWLDAHGAEGWRKAVEDGRAPSELVLERLALTKDQIDRRVERLTGQDAYAAARRLARHDINLIRADRDHWLRYYQALAGRRLVLTSSATLASFTGFWHEYPDRSSLLIADEWTSDHPGFHARLLDKCILRRPPLEVEFALPAEAAITLDGAPFAVVPGRRRFRTLAIRQPHFIELTAGPGTLDVGDRSVRLTLDSTP